MTNAISNIEPGLDVCSAAYIATRPTLPTAAGIRGTCARCGRTGCECLPVSTCVSRTFTGFDGWEQPQGQGLCFVCAWIYRAPELRTAIHLITKEPTMIELGSAELGRALDGPLTGEQAVIVPLRPGRKHILPHARWGMVAVDDVAIPWSSRDALALQSMRRLRIDGFAVGKLREPAPPYIHLSRVPKDRWARIFEDWETLDRWRMSPPFWELAVRASAVSAVRA